MTRDRQIPQDVLTIEDPAPVILSSPHDGANFPLGGVSGNNVTIPASSASTITSASKTQGFVASAKAVLTGVDIMDQPVSTDAPLAMFERKGDHPVPRYSVTNMDGIPVGTNKFWGSLVLGNGNLPVFTQPYSVWVNKDSSLFGLAISQTDLVQLAYGPDPNANPVQYYYNPIGINSMALSATEFSADTSSVTTEALKPNSALLHLWANKGQFPTSKRMSCPLVHGMGFVTGRYLDLTPKITTGVFFRDFSYAGTITGNGADRQKWNVTLNDGKQWRIYATPNSGTRELQLQLVNNSIIQATGNFSGIIQIAKVPNTAQEYVMDMSAGTVVTDISVSASVSGAVGTYVFNFASVGGSITNQPFMYALPHQIDSFDATTKSKLQGSLQLKSLTQGLMTGLVSSSWTMIETDMPVSVGWLPGSTRNWSAKTLNAIRSAIANEIGFDVINASNLSSQYYSGKVSQGTYIQNLSVYC
ncbi:hypothetical protein ABW21_db0207991 [Orbilia brochopaga]|nr:hypothetical protein ABW21_db0207991 [Drechslerella brochopaga]